MGLESEGVSKCQEDKIGLERFAYELHDRLCCISVPTFAWASTSSCWSVSDWSVGLSIGLSIYLSVLKIVKKAFLRIQTFLNIREDTGVYLKVVKKILVGPSV